MAGWRKAGEWARIRPERDPFDGLPALPAPALAVAPAARTLADGLLAEIDGLLSRRDFLVGYWQAPGE